MHTANNETDFKKQCGAGYQYRYTPYRWGRIYGMTFIDHESRTVWNGSQLDKNLSANVFNDWWKEQAAGATPKCRTDKQHIYTSHK